MLYLFDLDSTLISGYMDNPDRNYNVWTVLPGRRERIHRLTEDGHEIGIITNQGGVAFGHVSEADVRYKLHQVAIAFGWRGVGIHDGGITHYTGAASVLPVWVCYDDARAKDPRYVRDHGRRKPSSAMLFEAMQYLRYGQPDTVYIGDRPEDEQAAAAAGVRFFWVDDFFLRYDVAV